MADYQQQQQYQPAPAAPAAPAPPVTTPAAQIQSQPNYNPTPSNDTATAGGGAAEQSKYHRRLSRAVNGRKRGRPVLAPHERKPRQPRPRTTPLKRRTRSYTNATKVDCLAWLQQTMVPETRESLATLAIRVPSGLTRRLVDDRGYVWRSPSYAECSEFWKIPISTIGAWWRNRDKIYPPPSPVPQQQQGNQGNQAGSGSGSGSGGGGGGAGASAAGAGAAAGAAAAAAAPAAPAAPAAAGATAKTAQSISSGSSRAPSECSMSDVEE